ncbi:MAG: RHS repeat protein, partial [Algicola sp.]|nr:RHS repeat protein [Algicola sp.]
MNKFTLFVILCGLTFFSSSSLSQDALHKKAPPPLLVSHVDVLNELSERRRVSRFFKNEQSSFYGQQLGYVNTAKANTTFAVRDMVVAGRVPLVMARIYDSSLGEGGDFGQGWQLSFAQTIQKLADGSLLYRDGTADELRFIPASVGFNITPAQNSDIKAVDFNDLGQIEITYLDNWIKRFELLGGKYRLVSINDNNNNALRLTYVENQLSKISGDNNRAVTIYRNNGKIVRIEDNANRVVKYHYNAKDRLVGVDDLGGNQWKYRYHGTGLLHKVIDPEGKTAAKFRFGKDGKTTSAKVRWQKHNFQYQGNKTHVKDANGDETIFEHNASGITTAVINAEGLISQIELSDRNQITGLMHNNVQQAQIVYDENGRPLRYDINAKPTAMERNFAQYSYRYDGEGRTLAIEGAEKTLVNYEYDTKGNLTRHKTAKFDRSYQYADNGDVLVETESHRGLPANTTTYSYNADGLMASLTTSGQTARFDYNAVGRLAKVTFSDDSSHQYKYNKLGFRTQTTRSDHSLVDYGYDKVGNLTQSVKRTTATSEGKINGLTLNAQNQVTKITNDGNAVMSVKYSAKGNPVKITQGDISTEYQYDGLGRLTGVNDSNKGQVNYVYQADEEDIRLQFDDRTKGAISTQTKITGHNQTQTQLQYASVSGSPWQAVVWSPALAKFLVPSPEQIAAPDDSFQSSKQRRRLYDAKSTIKGHQINFDKPSNAFSKPAEYAVANCSTDDSGAEMDCYLYGVILDAASTITVGSPYTFSALAIADDDCLVKAYTFSIDNVIRGY